VPAPSGAPTAPIVPGSAAATGQVPQAPVAAAPRPQGPAVQVNPAQGPGSQVPASPMAGQPGYDASGKPVQMMGEGATAFKARSKDWEESQKSNRKVEEAGRTTVVKEASDVVANAPKFLDQIDIVNKGIKLTDERNNLGSILQGIIPGEQTVGSMIGTKDANNTKKIMEAVQLVSAQGMKVLGSNPTDADRDYLTKNVPDESWPAVEVKGWLKERRDFIIRKIEMAKEQVKSGGTTLPTIPGTPSDTGIKIIKREKIQ
jgi:hypothetical protein